MPLGMLGQPDRATLIKKFRDFTAQSVDTVGQMVLPAGGPVIEILVNANDDLAASRKELDQYGLFALHNLTLLRLPSDFLPTLY